MEEKALPLSNLINGYAIKIDLLKEIVTCKMAMDGTIAICEKSIEDFLVSFFSLNNLHLDNNTIENLKAFILNGKEQFNIFEIKDNDKTYYYKLTNRSTYSNNKWCVIEENNEKEYLRYLECGAKMNDEKRHYNKKMNFLIDVFSLLISKSKIKDSLSICVKLIGEYFAVDRVLIYTNQIDNYISWINPSCEKADDFLKTHSDSIRVLWEKYIFEKSARIDEIESIKKASPKFYEYLNSQKIKSVFAQPLYDEEKEIGAIRIDMCSPRIWSDSETDTIRTLGKLIGLYIEKYFSLFIREQIETTDELTGLDNYIYFSRKIKEKLENNTTGAIVSLNVRKFKFINEENGYEFGDKVLKIVAETLTKHKILASRISGDRFVFFLEKVKKEDLDSFFKSFIDYFEKESSILLNIHQKIIFGAGVCFCSKANNFSKMVDRAILAMKLCYNDMKNSYNIFTEKMQREYVENNRLSFRLIDALEKDKFEVYLQPKVNFNNEKLVGMEALSRLKIDGNNIPPDVFIPVFEKTGLITKFDFIVLRKVCSFLKKLIREGKKPVPCSVNLSRKQDDFVSYLSEMEKIRKEYDIPSELLEVEITESMLSDNYTNLINFIIELRKIGYKVSIDDFGCGYSNLELLGSGNFDILKLDKKICNVYDDEKKKAIVAMICNLSKTLSIDVLCEGVETANQAHELKNIGCKYCQGYYYDKPLKMADLEEKYYL